MVDMETAALNHGDRVSFCGNFDPVAVMLQGSADQVFNSTISCMQMGGSRSFSAAGCEIPDGTPEANIRAQSRALAEFFN